MDLESILPSGQNVDKKVAKIGFIYTINTYIAYFMPRRLESDPKSSSSPEKKAEEEVLATVGAIDESDSEAIEQAIGRVSLLMQESICLFCYRNMKTSE